MKKILLSIVMTSLAFFTGASVALATNTISLDTTAFGTAANCASCSVTYTTGASVTTNGMVVFSARGGSSNLASFKFNGTSATVGGSANTSGIDGNSFYFTPTTTVNVLTWTQTQDDAWYGIESYNCATATDEIFMSSSGAGGSPTITFAGGVTGEWAVGLFATAGAITTGWSGTPLVVRNSGGGANSSLADSGQTISGSTVYTWSVASFNYLIGGMSIKPVVGVTCPAVVAGGNGDGDDDWWFMEFFGWLF